ncbi:MAG: site-specific tyrosine recombinase/integron integrase [Candidatus Woesearchaeota archaeon]
MKMPDFKDLEVELKIRGFSKHTALAYIRFNHEFILFCQKSRPNLTKEGISKDDVKAYLAFLISDRMLSAKTVNLARSALLFYYNEVLDRGFVNIKAPKVESRHIDILEKDEIKALLACVHHRKSELMLKVIYSAGLRVSELTGLKLEDIDFERALLNVKQSKGKKDRVTVLSRDLLEEIKSYAGENGIKKGLLFFSGDGRLSERNIQRIIKRAALKAGLKKNVTPHTLRHSFATHLLESGVSIRLIQELLGHSNLQTTQIYTHVSTRQIEGVKSPLDGM